MLLIITTTRAPASDLGFLLHKHLAKAQTFDVSVGTAVTSRLTPACVTRSGVRRHPRIRKRPPLSVLIDTPRARPSRAFFPQATSFGVATGEGFADALSGGAFAGAHSQPILLVAPSWSLPEPVHAFISTHASSTGSLEVFGGSAAVSEAVVTAIGSALSGG